MGIRALLNNMEEKNSTSTTPPKPEVVKELAGSVALLTIEEIEVNPFQPRVEFDEEALQELSASIGIHGLIQPITVRRLNAHAYQLISGERRLRASKRAGLTEIPAYIRLADDQEMLEMALVENIQRENLNAVEVAITYQRLLDECSLTHEELSERVGKKRSTVTNFLRLLKLPPEIQQAIKSKKLSMGHARALVGVDDLATQLTIFRQVVNMDLSVRQTEMMIRNAQNGTKKPQIEDRLTAEYAAVRKSLRDYLGARVELKRNNSGKGQIIIPFGNDKDLNRLLDLIEE